MTYFVDWPRPRKPCQLGWHSWELRMPLHNEPFAVCNGGCNRRATVEEAQLNRAWQDRQLAKAGRR